MEESRFFMRLQSPTTCIYQVITANIPFGFEMLFLSQVCRMAEIGLFGNTLIARFCRDIREKKNTLI